MLQAAQFSSTRRPGLYLCLFFVFVSLACRDGGTLHDDTRRVTDDLNRVISIPILPERVATLAPAMTELVFAAGAGDRLVGVSTADDYPPEVMEIPRFDALQVEVEHLLTLEPQLLLATDQVNSPQKANQLEALGIPTYFFRFTTIESVMASIERTGELIGTRDLARRNADSLRAVYARSFLDLPDDERPLVLMLIDTEMLYSFGGESYVNEIIEHVGGRSATAHLDGDAAMLSEEFVLGIGPDVIIIAGGDDYDLDRVALRYPSWRHTPAIRSGRVYSMDPDIILRPGPRLTQAAPAIASFIHGTTDAPE